MTDKVGQWFYELNHVTFFLKYILVCKSYNVPLPNLFRPNVNFISGSSKKLHTRKHF